MTKKDYREKIEEDRQQIDVEGEHSRLSRSKRNKKKKRKSPLMSILLVIFILIPLSLLVYVKFIYEPTPAVKTEVADENESVQMETNDAAKMQSEKNEQEAAKKIEEDKQVAEVEATKVAEADTATKVAAQKAEQEAATKKAEQEAAALKAAQAEAAEKAEQEAAAKKAAEQQAQSSSKSHVVQNGDTLYSIAMKYYGYPEAVEKIKSANNITADSISTGRMLVLP